MFPSPEDIDSITDPLLACELAIDTLVTVDSGLLLTLFTTEGHDCSQTVTKIDMSRVTNSYQLERNIFSRCIHIWQTLNKKFSQLLTDSFTGPIFENP